MRRTPCRSGVVPAALLLLALTLLTLAARITTAMTDPIYLLRLVYDTTDVSGDENTAMWDGMNAALYAGSSAGSYKSLNGQTITVVTRSVGADPTNSVTVVQNALADYPTLLAILGPGNSAGLDNLLSSTVLSSNSLVCFSPFTYSSELRYWTPYLYYTRVDPQAELLLLLNYALNTLRVIRVGFMYLSGTMIGDVEYARTVTVFSKAGLNAPVLYTAAFDNAASLNTTAFDAMADAGVQAIIIFASPTPQTRDFVRQALTDSRTSAAVLLGPSMLMSLLQEQYTLLSNAGTVTYQDNHVLNSLTNEMPNMNNYGFVQVFQTQMTDYITNSGTSSYTDSSYYLTNLTMGAAMLSGWIGGQVLMLTLENLEWTTNAVRFRAGLFRQNRYFVVPDYVAGDYGGTCDSFASAQGAMCFCNQGGHTAYLASLVNDEFTSTGVNYSFSSTQCYTTAVSVNSPLNIILLNITDSAVLVNAASVYSTLSMISSPSSTSTSSGFSFNTALVDMTSSRTDGQTALDTYLNAHAAAVVRGPFLPSKMTTGLLVLSPYNTKAMARTYAPTVFTLRPTTEQFFYILMKNYAALGVSTARVVLRGYDAAAAAAIMANAEATADNFNVDVPKSVSISDTDDLASAFDKKGLSMFMGIVSGDAVIVAAFLTANTKATVWLLSHDFYLFYDEFYAAFASVDTSVQDRLLFLTNFPLWTDTSAAAHDASVALNAYHSAAPAPYTPMGMDVFVTTWFLESVVSNVVSSNATAFIDFIYGIGMVAAKDIVLGEFKRDCPDPSASTCILQNYGARDITAMSMHRVFDPTVALTLRSSTPAMTYAPRIHRGLTKGQLAGVIAGAVIGGLLLVGVLLIFYYCFVMNKRDNESAPKQAQDPVTLIFTDIESSTALWAALPQLMPEAVATHHSIIRAAIRKYKCYEVKTIGDSFMIACKDAHAAVKLVKEVQVKFLEHDWKTDEIDETYRMFEIERAQEDEEKKPHTAQLSLETYDTMWRGLRVRMGIHTGLSDIRLDEVTGGYDYYGDTSNMAARTEAVANGGQVIMTEATWWGLSDAARAELEHTKMGPQGLRGVPYAVGMYQLNPVEGREHCKLRTEIDAVLPDDDTTYTGANTTEDGNSWNTNMSTTATAVAFVLSNCFSTYPPPQRIRELQPLLSKWNVASPPKPKGISDEDYCKSLFDRLAVRVGRVTEARIKQNGGDGRTMSNLLPSFAGTGVQSHNPLGDQGSYIRQPSVGGASQRSHRSRGQGAVGELRVFFHSIVSSHASAPSRGRRGTHNNASSSASGQDNVVPFTSSPRRGAPVEGRQARGESTSPSMNTSGTLTRRTRRASGKSESGNADTPLEE